MKSVSFVGNAFLRISLFGLTVNCFLHFGLTQNIACETPIGEPGTCILPQRCTYIQNKLDSYGGYWNIPDELKQIIQKSRCTGRTQGLHICCPNNPDRTTISTKNSGGKSENGYEILKSQNCGNIQGKRVAHGIEAYLREFPFMALLEYDSKEQPYKCGGTLITNRYILTAAHCIKSGETLVGVVLGEHDLSSERDCQRFARRMICNNPVQKFNISRSISHPNYSKSLLINDIALIKLDRDVVFDAQVSPICLPLYDKTNELDKTKPFYIAGWGKTHTTGYGQQATKLQYAALNLKSNDYCEHNFTRAFEKEHLCAVGEKGQDSCRGDSGGPLFSNRPYTDNINKYIQYGIVSFGVKGCGISENAYPGIYANVIELLPWIAENID